MATGKQVPELKAWYRSRKDVAVLFAWTCPVVIAPVAPGTHGSNFVKSVSPTCHRIRVLFFCHGHWASTDSQCFPCDVAGHCLPMVGLPLILSLALHTVADLAFLGQSAGCACVCVYSLGCNSTKGTSPVNSKEEAPSRSVFKSSLLLFVRSQMFQRSQTKKIPPSR